jgi:hypothetical protein
MIRCRLCFLVCLLLLVGCQDHPPLLQPQSTPCLVQQIKIAYTDPAGYQHWSAHQYDAQGRIRLTTDSSDTWKDSTYFTYSDSQVRKSYRVSGFSGNPHITTYNLTSQGYILRSGYHYDQDGYLLEINTPDQFHRVYTYSGGNLIKQVLDDGGYQIVYTYEYDTTRTGVPFSVDLLDLFFGKPSRNLLLHVNAVAGWIGSSYVRTYTYVDNHYVYDSRGRVTRCEREHFIYGHSISEYSYGCP